jgi:hypothetical protein
VPGCTDWTAARGGLGGGVVGAVGGAQLLPAVDDQPDRDEQCQHGDDQEQRH